jgi:hypothetical protein
VASKGSRKTALEKGVADGQDMAAAEHKELMTNAHVVEHPVTGEPVPLTQRLKKPVTRWVWGFFRVILSGVSEN